MDHVKIDRAHFLGLSMGGMVGQYLGLAAPKRFNSLTAGVDQQPHSAREARHLWVERVKVAREKGMASQAADLHAALAHGGQPAKAGAGGAPVAR